MRTIRWWDGGAWQWGGIEREVDRFQRCVRSSLDYLRKCDQIWGIRETEETGVMLKSADKLLVIVARTVSLEL